MCCLGLFCGRAELQKGSPLIPPCPIVGWVGKGQAVRSERGSYEAFLEGQSRLGGDLMITRPWQANSQEAGWVVVAHAFNPGTLQTEAGGSL